MAYLFSDGFDNYTTLSQLWEGVQGTPTIASANARFSTAGITSQGVKFAQNSWGRKNLPSNYASIIVGFAYLMPAMPGSFTGIVTLDDTNTTQIYLAVTASGAFQFYRGTPNTGTAIGSASAGGLIAPNQWHFLEIVVTIDPSAGAVALYIDQPASGGTAAINSTGLNTRTTTNSSCNQVRIGDYNVFTPSFDDIYVLDTTGSSPLNGRLGDQRIITKMPNGVGALTNWSVTGSAANWSAVNEIPPDDDTSYVSSNTAGQQDSYAMQSASITATPNFVVVRVRKDDASAHTCQALVRSGGTVGLGTAFTVPSSYAYFDSLFVNDPNTGSPWTGSAADSTQVGQDETS